jgi:hypothetical protein
MRSDMISTETEAEIARLYHGAKWPVGTIATQLRVHHTTVHRVLGQVGVEPKVVAPPPSMADPFEPFIKPLTRARFDRRHTNSTRRQG